MTTKYNDPYNGTPSSMTPQMRDFAYKRKALFEAMKEQYFLPLADVTAMPKHYGKNIKLYHYLPMLSDANINSEGIDAAGQIANGTVGKYKVTIAVDSADQTSTGNGYVTRYFIGEDTTAANALTAAKLAVVEWAEKSIAAGGLGLTTAAGTTAQKYTEVSTTGGASAFDLGFTFVEHTEVPNTGNLYGSSKDIGTISGKLPTLLEEGGRVNRVGFTRIDIEGQIQNYGIFHEYTEDSYQFDSDDKLEMHLNREMVNGASQVTEAKLQIDLLNSAGVTRFGGIATATSELTGENGVTHSVVSYEDLMRLSVELDNNRCPKRTTRITGTRYTDTKTLDNCRVLYVGSELVPQLKQLKDSVFNDRAFIPVQKYAAGGETLTGEIGSIDNFRIVVVPEMLHWAGAGAAVTTNDGFRETGGNYDAFPMLCVGDGSFTTIGFQTDGKSTKFKTYMAKPGSQASLANDPYGKKGFSSIQWWYGFMALRSERIALVKTLAAW